MNTLGNIAILGLISLIVGCSSSSNTTSATNNGGAAATGGHASMGGAGTTLGGSGSTVGGSTATGTGTSINLGDCNMPSCVLNLMSTCLPSGTCVGQMDMTTFSSNMCFSNGVKVGMEVDFNSGAINLVYKNGATTCYTIAGTTDSSDNEILTFKNASGTTVATGTSNSANNTTTITCAGGQPVTLNAACDSSDPVPTGDSNSDCTDGTCTL